MTTQSNFATLLHVCHTSSAAAAQAVKLFNGRRELEQDGDHERELTSELAYIMQSAIETLGGVSQLLLRSFGEGVEQVKNGPPTVALEWPLIGAISKNIKLVRGQHELFLQLRCCDGPYWIHVNVSLEVLEEFNEDFELLEKLLEWAMKVQDAAEMTKGISNILPSA